MAPEKNPPDALCCFNDNVAVDTYILAKDLGLKVGQDIGIFGYDKTTICETSYTPLSSIEMNSYDIGFSDASLLLAMQQGKDITMNIQILNTVLLERESSKRI